MVGRILKEIPSRPKRAEESFMSTLRLKSLTPSRASVNVRLLTDHLKVEEEKGKNLLRMVNGYTGDVHY